MEPATSHQPTRSSKLEPTANLRPAAQRLETLARNATLEVEDNPAHGAVDNFIASAKLTMMRVACCGVTTTTERTANSQCETRTTPTWYS